MMVVLQVLGVRRENRRMRDEKKGKSFLSLKVTLERQLTSNVTS